MPPLRAEVATLLKTEAKENASWRPRRGAPKAVRGWRLRSVDEEELSKGPLDVRRVSDQPTTPATGQPRRLRRTWPLPLSLVAALAVILGARWGYPTFENRHWPERITVNGRDYDNAAPGAAPVSGQADQGWQRLATVGPGDYPVYARVVRGQVPTIVWVQIAPDTYDEYTLMGGP
jgi:hypothetical protein